MRSLVRSSCGCRAFLRHQIDHVAPERHQVFGHRDLLIGAWAAIIELDAVARPGFHLRYIGIRHAQNVKEHVGRIFVGQCRHDIDRRLIHDMADAALGDSADGRREALHAPRREQPIDERADARVAGRHIIGQHRLRAVVAVSKHPLNGFREGHDRRDGVGGGVRFVIAEDCLDVVVTCDHPVVDGWTVEDGLLAPRPCQQGKGSLRSSGSKSALKLWCGQLDIAAMPRQLYQLPIR